MLRSKDGRRVFMSEPALSTNYSAYRPRAVSLIERVRFRFALLAKHAAYADRPAHRRSRAGGEGMERDAT